MARKSEKRRLAEQSARQAKTRDEARKACRPDRDDLARMLLWLMIREAHSQGQRERSKRPMDKLCELLVGNLVKQGFDEFQTLGVFEALEAKYPKQLAPREPSTFGVKDRMLRPFHDANCWPGMQLLLFPSS